MPLMALIALAVSARADCGYTEATGGGEKLIADYPTWKRWSYTCNQCTCTDNYTYCQGPFPHWTLKYADLDAATGLWDITTFGSCDDVHTFPCVYGG